jgi:hypothetical protein
MDFRFGEKEDVFRKEAEDFIKKELASDWTEKNIYWPGDTALYQNLKGLTVT